MCEWLYIPIEETTMMWFQYMDTFGTLYARCGQSAINRLGFGPPWN
ncbi:unnamed protein product [Larinioides sclopetarius]|uniref:Uncharacterized protein n=1 Tax=Larinioides sclopetarius TaxID=280406 RepID=A0AAV1ZAS1_9ARAC